MDAVGFAIGYLEVTRPGSASADNDGIVFFSYLDCIDIDTDVCIRNEDLKLCYFGVKRVIEVYLQHPRQPLDPSGAAR